MADLFDIVVARKLSGGGGGGGSSDFSTAEVTLTFGGQWCGVAGAFVNSNASLAGAPDGISSGDTATLILYKGRAEIWSNDTVTSTSGDIEYDDVSGHYFVTGNCSITTS